MAFGWVSQASLLQQLHGWDMPWVLWQWVYETKFDFTSAISPLVPYRPRVSYTAINSNVIYCDNQSAIALANNMEYHTSSADLPFDFLRTMFPLRLAFAITINKSQG